MTAVLPPHVRLNESVTLRCALGIRFRDPATRQIVASGLRVQATPLNAPPGTTPVRAEANRSGVWLFYGLPRLRAFELGAETELLAFGSPLHAPQFRVEVEDEENRFLPCTFVATASQTGPMKFTARIASPPDEDAVTLFSSPAREVPPGCAVIRAHLVDPLQKPPDNGARWALMEATSTVRNRRVSEIRTLGLANDKGNVALIFPWPELVGVPVSLSPPGGLRLAAQDWDFTFSAWYDASLATAGLADLDAVFARLQQSPSALRTQESPPQPFHRGSLVYGRELIVPDFSALSPPFGDGAVPRSLIVTN